MPDKESWRFIGQRIRVLRKSNQLTIKQLANGCGLSSNAISLVERGEVAPTVATLCKIAHALGTTLATFFNQACPEDDDAQEDVQIGDNHPALSCSLDHSIDHLEDMSLINLTQLIPGKALPSILCLLGQLEFTLNNQCHRLSPGEVVLVDHSQLHNLQNIGKETGVVLLFLPVTQA